MVRSLPEHLAAAAGQGSRALARAVRTWVGAVGQLARALPDPVMVVDSTFDAAEQVLQAQREFALGVLRLAGLDRDDRIPRTGV